MSYNFEHTIEIKPDRYAYVQSEPHKISGKQVVSEVCALWSPPPWCYHLGKRGGHVEALRIHQHSNWFAAIDLENFFGSVNKSKLTRALKKLKLATVDVRRIAYDATVRNGDTFSIPYGFVQSSALATLALDKSALGKTIRLLVKNGIIISAYVDDIILSCAGNQDPLDDALSSLIDAAHQSSFLVNDAKTQPPDRMVQAFNIDLYHGGLSICDDRMLEFREKVIRNGDSLSSRAVIRYVKSVNEQQAQQLADEIGLPY